MVSKDDTIVKMIPMEMGPGFSISKQDFAQQYITKHILSTLPPVRNEKVFIYYCLFLFPDVYFAY